MYTLFTRNSGGKWARAAVSASSRAPAIYLIFISINQSMYLYRERGYTRYRYICIYIMYQKLRWEMGACSTQRLLPGAEIYTLSYISISYLSVYEEYHTYTYVYLYPSLYNSRGTPVESGCVRHPAPPPARRLYTLYLYVSIYIYIYRGYYR